MDICQITQAPTNISQFVDNISPEYRRIYGRLAEATYRLNGPDQLAATISHPGIRAYGILDKQQARALLFARPSTDRHLISFFHVVPELARPDDALNLLRHVHRDLAATSERAIYTDFIPLGSLALDHAFDALGYRQVKRAILRKECRTSRSVTHCDYDVRTATAEDIPALATLLCLVYATHPESHLFEEVRSMEEACVFLSSTMMGAYGPCPPGYIIGAWDGPTCIALAIGCNIVAEMGFVLHMAVHPDYQGCGTGRHVLTALTNEFIDHQLPRVALGVTCTNPAVHLYRTAGFDAVHHFPVYYHLATTNTS